MDITKAKRVVELTKDNKRILVTLWDGDKISSCVEEESRQQCESCEGDEQCCNEFIEYLKERGYQATELQVTGPEVEESLPRFIEEREARVQVLPIVAEGSLNE